MQLREYQVKAVNAIKNEFKSGIRSTLLVLATGLGKTIAFTQLAKEYFEYYKSPVLVLAHRSELLLQAQKVFYDFGLMAEIEKADRYARAYPHDAVIASVQSLAQQKRLDMYPKDYFGFVIIDEAQHAVSSTYRRILSHFDQAKVLGVTATPNRHDEIGLKNVFQSCAYQYSIQDGIKDGYLCNVRGKQVQVEDLRLEDVKIVAGDFSQSDLDEMLRKESVLQGMVLPTMDLAESRPTIVFTPGVEHAHEIAGCFNRIKKDSAVAVDGGMEEQARAHALQMFERGERQFIVNVGILTEGYDHPPTACIALFRPTRSLGLLAQCLDMATEVLTKNGFTKEVKEGDWVAGWNYTTGEIVWTPAISVIKRKVQKEEKWCSYDNPQTSIRVTDQHRMFYDTKRKKGWKETTAAHLSGLSAGMQLPVAGYIKKTDLPLTDDEIRLIGWMITDGSVSWTARTAYICQGEHQPYCAEIDRVLTACGIRFKKTVRWRNTQFNQTSPAVKWQFSQGAPRRLTEKHLKGWGYLSKYLENDSAFLFEEISERQLDILLETMHLADGSKQNGQSWTRRSYHIHEHPSLIEKIQRCAVIRGWRASVAIISDSLYTIHLKKQDYVSIGSRHDNRPIWEVTEPSDDDFCWCVENWFGTLVTRRNGKVTILGNCIGRGTRLSEGKEDCIASGQRVLTDVGLVPIEQVTLDMKVWDGCNFVSHCGTIFRGEQEVITYAGLTATPDHQVWTRDGWRTMQECATEQIPIAITGIGEQTVRETEGHFRGNCACQKPAVPLNRVYRVRKTKTQRTSQRHQRSSRLSPSFGSEMVVNESHISQTTVYESERLRLRALRWQRNRISVQVTNRNGDLGAKQSRITQRFRNRSYRQQPTLRTGQFAIFHTTAEFSQHPKNTDFGKTASFSTKVSRNQICRCYVEPDVLSGDDTETNNRTILSTFVQTKRGVWDILNAGRLHRFTVEGLLVSNCLVLDFVGVDNTVKTLNVLDVLDGSVLSEKEKIKAQEFEEEGDDAMTALEKAKNFVADLDSIKAKMRALTTANAFDVLQMFAVPSSKGMYGGDLATPKQIAFLTKLGVKCPSDLQKGEAIKLIDKMTKRIDKGLATFKQLKYLKSLGYKDSEIETLSFKDASEIIGNLKSKGARG